MRLKSSAHSPAAGIAVLGQPSSGIEAGQLFGEYLVSQGLLRQEDVPEILRHQAEHGGAFGEIAVQLGRIDAQQLERVSARYMGFPLLPPGTDEVHPLVVAATSVDDPYVVKMRTIRAKIVASAKERATSQHRQMVALVGIGASEEVSVMAANLAVIYAQLGINTAAIDFGLQAPSLHMLLRVPNQNGVSLGFGGDQFSVAAQQTAISNLWAVPAGPVSAAAASYMQRHSLTDVVDSWHLSADQVIACLPAMDQSIASLGTMLEGFDGVVLVARRDVTPIADIRAAIDSLDMKSVPIVGSVIG